MINYIPLDAGKVSELTVLWNKEIGHHFPMREELFLLNSFSDVNVLHEGSWIAENEEHQPVGFVISKFWNEDLGDLVLGNGMGWIQVLLVDAEYRKQGIGSELLLKAEKALSQAGAETISLGKDPWHYFPGIPYDDHPTIQWFDSRGYGYVETVHDLLCDNPEKFNDSLPQLDDVTFRLLIPEEDNEKFMAFFDRCFPGRWKYEAYHYLKKGGTGREFVVVEKDDKIIGFCRLNDDESPFIAQNVYWSPLFKKTLGGIGPLGIDRDYRKFGYGLAVVKAATYFLKQRGINTIAIDWTGLVDFYGKLGFKVWKSYNVHLKKQQQ